MFPNYPKGKTPGFLDPLLLPLISYPINGTKTPAPHPLQSVTSPLVLKHRGEPCSVSHQAQHNQAATLRVFALPEKQGSPAKTQQHLILFTPRGFRVARSLRSHATLHPHSSPPQTYGLLYMVGWNVVNKPLGAIGHDCKN